MENLNYDLWLDSISGLSRENKIRLIQYAGSGRELFELNEELINNINFLSEENRKEIIRKKKIDEVQRVNKYLNASKISFVSICDKLFPEKLRNIYDPPFGLYYRGRLPEPGKTSIAIVGARMCDAYGRTWALKLARALSEVGVQVISGMAYGIDAASHWGAIKGGEKTYAVLGCGVDVVYPSDNRKLYETILNEDGGIISEFFPGTKPKPYQFPIRNRIISGLSDAIVLIQAKEKSGSLITADLAMEQGKDVYVLPGRPDDALSKGCNQLIKQGAGVILSIQDLLFDLKLEGKFTEPKMDVIKKSLEKGELLVYSDLDLNPKSLEDIYNEVKCSRQEILAALIALESKGLVEECFMNFYKKTC